MWERFGLVGAGGAVSGSGRSLRRRARFAGDGTVGFALRLVAAFTLTLLLVGVVGFLLMDHELRRSQVQSHAAMQQADARTFEAKGAEEETRAAVIREIDEVMDAIARAARVPSRRC